VNRDLANLMKWMQQCEDDIREVRRSRLAAWMEGLRPPTRRRFLALDDSALFNRQRSALKCVREKGCRRYATSVFFPLHPALTSRSQTITPLRGCFLSAAFPLALSKTSSVTNKSDKAV